MLRVQVKEYISSLNDAELLEYVMTGRRMYEPEPLEYAREELKKRNLSSQQIDALKSDIEQKLVKYDYANPVPQNQPPIREGVVCQQCQCEVPNRHVEYHQNIGAFVIRFNKTYSGHLCKRCNRSIFWQCTLITFFLGW